MSFPMMSSVFHPFPQHRKSVQGVNFQELLYADDTHLSLPVAPGLSTTVYIWMISVLVYIIHLFQFPERQHTFQEWKQNADFIRCQIFGRRACKPNSTDSSWIVTKNWNFLSATHLLPLVALEHWNPPECHEYLSNTMSTSLLCTVCKQLHSCNV